MSKIFIETYIANNKHHQGLHSRGLPPPPTKTLPPM
jgi:hypothetical protein